MTAFCLCCAKWGAVMVRVMVVVHGRVVVLAVVCLMRLRLVRRVLTVRARR